jgi:hypothetical protein
MTGNDRKLDEARAGKREQVQMDREGKSRMNDQSAALDQLPDPGNASGDVLRQLSAQIVCR